MSTCSLPYPVPKVQKEMFKQEVEHLVVLGVLELANYSEWVAPYFWKPKPKSNQVHFLSEFRNLNKKLKQKKPNTKNQWNVIEIGFFWYATSLDLNMGYYHIWLV